MTELGQAVNHLAQTLLAEITNKNLLGGFFSCSDSSCWQWILTEMEDDLSDSAEYSDSDDNSEVIS